MCRQLLHEKGVTWKNFKHQTFPEFSYEWLEAELDTGMIRFVEQEGEKMYFKSGGGITCQSDVESEYIFILLYNKTLRVLILLGFCCIIK